jgi:hypothetical protein
MKKYTKIVLLSAVILLLGFGFWNLTRENRNSAIPNTKVVREFKANLTINNGVDTVSFDATAFIGKTVLEATQTATNGKLETTGTGKNAFVTSINGRSADPAKREFWELIVNGLQAEVGAGSYIIKEGDQIEWHMNKF